MTCQDAKELAGSYAELTIMTFVKLPLSVCTVGLPTSRFTDDNHAVLSRNTAQLPDQRLGRPFCLGPVVWAPMIHSGEPLADVRLPSQRQS